MNKNFTLFLAVLTTFAFSATASTRKLRVIPEYHVRIQTTFRLISIGGNYSIVTLPLVVDSGEFNALKAQGRLGTFGETSWNGNGARGTFYGSHSIDSRLPEILNWSNEGKLFCVGPCTADFSHTDIYDISTYGPGFRPIVGSGTGAYILADSVQELTYNFALLKNPAANTIPIKACTNSQGSRVLATDSICAANGWSIGPTVGYALTHQAELTKPLCLITPSPLQSYSTPVLGVLDNSCGTNTLVGYAFANDPFSWSSYMVNNFNPYLYMALYPEVVAAGYNEPFSALDHINRYGLSEGRRVSEDLDPKFIAKLKGISNPTPAQLVALANEAMKQRNQFEVFWSSYPSYRDLCFYGSGDCHDRYVLSAQDTTLLVGSAEVGWNFTVDPIDNPVYPMNEDVKCRFDADYYLAHNPDVAASGYNANPLSPNYAVSHWIKYGLQQQRMGGSCLSTDGIRRWTRKHKPSINVNGWSSLNAYEFYVQEMIGQYNAYYPHQGESKLLQIPELLAFFKPLSPDLSLEGDFNLDNQVDLNDFLQLRNAIGTVSRPHDLDFSYGPIDLLDLIILRGNLGRSRY